MTATTRWIGLAVFVAVCLGAGGLGAIATTPEIAGWYRTLAKPAWNPPGWIFGPVWSALYTLMAVAAWLVWRAAGLSAAKGPLALYLVQLALNALWTWVFFRWRLGGWALTEIMVLWLVLVPTVVNFWRVRPVAGVLLLPYWAWVTFAAALTAAVWQRNPGVL